MFRQMSISSVLFSILFFFMQDLSAQVDESFRLRVPRKYNLNISLKKQKSKDPMDIIRMGGNDAGNGGFLVRVEGELMLLDIVEGENHLITPYPLHLHPNENYKYLFTEINNSEIKKILKNFYNFEGSCLNDLCKKDMIPILNAIWILAHLDSRGKGSGNVDLISELQKIKLYLVLNEGDSESVNDLFTEMYHFPSRLNRDLTGRIIQAIPFGRVLGKNILINSYQWNQVQENTMKTAFIVHETLQYLLSKYTDIAEEDRLPVRQIIRHIFIHDDFEKASGLLRELLSGAK
jgi:hypothetical protein